MTVGELKRMLDDYDEHITIVSIKLEDMENSMAVVMPRFHIGARWFDDIVMNNAAREK